MACTALTSWKNAISALWCWVEEIWQDMVNNVCDLRLETADLRRELKRMQAEIDRLRAQVQHNEDKDRKRQFSAQQQGLLELSLNLRTPRLPQFEKIAPSPDVRAVHACLAKAAREIRRIDSSIDVTAAMCACLTEAAPEIRSIDSSLDDTAAT